jgi:hypothetical protein
MEIVTVLRVMLWAFFGLVLLSVLVCLIRKLLRKSPRLERTLTVLIIASTLFGTAYWLISRGIESWRASRNEKVAADKRAKMSRLQTQEAIEALITTNQAVRDWKNNLCAQASGSPVFTSELQSALVRTDNRPVLVTGLLNDTRSEAGHYVLTVTSYLCRETELRFELVAGPDEARLVLMHQSESVPYYAVAAEIAGVEKSDSTSENGNSVFVVRGQCSNLVFTGFDGFSIDMDERRGKGR